MVLLKWIMHTARDPGPGVAGLNHHFSGSSDETFHGGSIYVLFIYLSLILSLWEQVLVQYQAYCSECRSCLVLPKDSDGTI